VPAGRVLSDWEVAKGVYAVALLSSAAPICYSLQPLPLALLLHALTVSIPLAAALAGRRWRLAIFLLAALAAGAAALPCFSAIAAIHFHLFRSLLAAAGVVVYLGAVVLLLEAVA